MTTDLLSFRRVEEMADVFSARAEESSGMEGAASRSMAERPSSASRSRKRSDSLKFKIFTPLRFQRITECEERQGAYETDGPHPAGDHGLGRRARNESRTGLRQCGRPRAGGDGIGETRSYGYIEGMESASSTACSATMKVRMA